MIALLSSVRKLIFLVVIILLSVVIVVLTYITYDYSLKIQKGQSQEEYATKLDEINDRLSIHFSQYVNATYAAEAFLNSSDQVTRIEWREYINSIRLSERYAGITGMVYISAVNDADKERFIAEIRKDTSVNGVGYPDMQIQPVTKQSQYYPITYSEPRTEATDKNIGYDYSTDPVRKKVLDQARDTGQPVTSPRLLGVTTKAPFFLISQAVYRKGMPINTVEEKRKALRGFVVASMRTEELFKLFFPPNSQNISFQIYDVTGEGLLFNYPYSIKKENGVPQTKDTLLPVPSGNWTIKSTADAKYGIDRQSRSVPGFVIVTGILLLLFTNAVIMFMYYSQKHAIEIADKVEKKLKESEGKYKLIFDSFQDVFYQTDLQGVVTEISPSIEKYIGLKPEEVIGKKATDFYTHPEIRDELVAKLKENDGVVSDFPIELQGKDGKVFQTSLNAQLIYNALKLPVGLQGILRDITARKQEEDILRTQKQELERMNRVMVDRELKMIELKKELASLKGQ